MHFRTLEQYYYDNPVPFPRTTAKFSAHKMPQLQKNVATCYLKVMRVLILKSAYRHDRCMDQ
jgi:hypothetical protein